MRPKTFQQAVRSPPDGFPTPDRSDPGRIAPIIRSRLIIIQDFPRVLTAPQSGSGKVQITLDPANPMEALREVMKYVLPTDQLGEKEMGSAFLPLVYDRNSVMCSVVESHDGFPSSDQFDFHTIEGFMNGFNQMEKPMAELRNKAGETASELYNAFIKKRKHRRNPEECKDRL